MTIFNKSFPCTPDTNDTFMTSPVSVSQTVNSCGNITVKDVTVTNNATLTIVSCGDITIDNVTVNSGAKLILVSGSEAIIYEIDIQQGADFEILIY